MMELTTKSMLISSVVSRWKMQYYRGGQWTHSGKEEIYENLKSEEHLTEENITKIIGNSSWTKNACDECGKDSDKLVVIGQAPDYDSSTASICPDCLKKAIDLI